MEFPTLWFFLFSCMGWEKCAAACKKGWRMGKEGRFCGQVLGDSREQRKEKQAEGHWSEVKMWQQQEALGVGADTVLTSAATFWFQSLQVLRAYHQAY